MWNNLLKQILLLDDMFVEQTSELEHVDWLFAPENRFQFFIWANHPSVLCVLALMGFDVFP